MRNKQSTKPSVKKETSNLPVQESIRSSLFSGIFHGFSLGTGSAIAHNIFRTPLTIKDNDENTSKNCEKLFQDYEKVCSVKNEHMDMFVQKECESLYQNFKKTCF